MANENMVHFSVQPQENNKNNKNNEMEVDNNEDETLNPEEYQALNNKLDQLNSVLDSLERKNDDIHAELKSLLESNRKFRKQIQEAGQEE
ncbi:bublin coiled-coil protein [Leptopilina heterotoma]|uniref:bublin coiled-coil protein n=1 Tax=Leptopilina heterotoma TaxID=63436 RepID=UPI001CA95EC4|nr:bublin coiled-coil protein [Leptopilina heterotoma]